MPAITDITVPGESFALGRLLTEHPEIQVELERLVPLGDRVLPFFWVSGRPPADIEALLESRDVVGSAELLTTVEDRHLYQVTWTSEVNGLVDALLDTNGVIMEGQGLGGNWEFRLRFPDHEHLRRFSEICLEEGFEFDVRGIYNPHAPTPKDRLTSAQWQALAAAYEDGYFEIPRRATLSDLSERIGVSEQAISQRLRRATRSLVGSLMFSGE